MGAICQQSKIQTLQIINSFNQGLEKNMMSHPNEIPDKSYAMRVYGVPPLSEQVHKILTAQMERQKINEERYKGVQLPPFLVHRRQIYYQGQWRDKSPHGRGKIYFSEGHYFEGYLNDGQAECRNGILAFYDGSYYRGGFRNSQLSGNGRFVSNSGMIYEGNWENSKPEGLGKQYFKDGNSYEGFFVNGMKEGKGIFRWNDGKVYEGMFQNGKMNGRGKFYRGKEQYFEGQFEDNKKIGGGKLKTAYGIYDGPFENGQFSGQGTFVWNDKKIYEGEFKEGNLDGPGKVTFANGQTLKGLWREGQNVELLQLMPPSSSPKKKK